VSTTAAAGLAIGVDVGGTKVAAGIVDLQDGSIRARAEIPTRPERGGRAILDDVSGLLSELAAGGPFPVGVAVCELVDPSGAITSAQTLDWRDLDVIAALSSVGTATVESDVRAGALAEATFGAGRGIDPFVYVSVGTGISSTLVHGGVPYAGGHGTAIVAASGTFTVRCPHCGTDVAAVPEDIASGLGMARRLSEARPDVAVRGAEDVLAAASEGDELAARIVDEGGRMLGTVVAWLVNVLDPRAVVIGGGLGLAPGRYRDRFLAAFDRHVWAPTSRGTPVLDATLGRDAVVVGAALSARRGEG
jgi:glucokinase